MSQANLDLGVLQETNIKDGIYTCGSAGYTVVTTDAPSQHHDILAVLYRASLQFAVEDIQKFGPNVMSFQLAMGERRWYIIICYLSPENISMIESTAAALRERPQGTELLVVGDFNADLTQPDVARIEEDISVALVAAGFEDISAHFLPQRHPWCWDIRMWSMVRLGRELRSRTDCILGTDRCLFRNVSV